MTVNVETLVENVSSVRKASGTIVPDKNGGWALGCRIDGD